MFRLLLIGLLLAAVSIKPTLAFDCVLPHAAQQGTEQADVPGDAPLAVAGMGDDGCIVPCCHDGCAHTTAMLPADRLASVAPAAAVVPAPAIDAFRPWPTLTVFRPPIAS